MADQRAGKSIDEMEADAGELEVSVPAPPMQSDETDPWKAQSRKSDEFSETDGEPRVKLYTLSIPNKTKIGDRDNPGFRKLCLDKKLTIEPRELIRCIVLERVKPKISVVPFKTAEQLSNDEPWKKYLGYSFDGKKPTPDSAGFYFPRCMCSKDSPFSICSLPSKFEKGGGDVIVEDLKDGECPWGRWPNTLPTETLIRFKIKEETPSCNDNIIFYCYDLDILVPFRIFFKVTSANTAKEFIRSCTKGIGDEAVKYPWYAFEAQITVEDHGNYAIPKILNTGKFTTPSKIQPIITWFNTNRPSLVKNLIEEMKDAKERKEKQDKADSFDPEKLENSGGKQDAESSK